MHTIYLIVLVILSNVHKHPQTLHAFLHQNQRCPRMCTCNVYMGLNMANCSGQNLVSGNIGMSSLVEHLDLSNNDITMIDNDSFKDLRYLKTLLLNRNSIEFIELDAFSTLTALRSVNLTSNRLERFDNRIFEQNTHLTSVDLSGNKFMHLENRPILRSVSLEILNLHKSQLTHLHVNYFEDLPNIKAIDLSDNLLIVLNLVAFTMNNRLRSINVQGNRIKCDEQTEMSIIWLKKNHIKVGIDNCPKTTAPNSTPPKLQRMQMLPLNNTTPHSTRTRINGTLIDDLTSVWHTYDQNDHNIPILNERCRANETTVGHACHLFEICVSNLTMLVEEVEAKLLLNSAANMKEKYELGNLHHTWNEFVTVKVAFYGGLLLGTMVGAIILFTMKLISDCLIPSTQLKSQQAMRRKRRNRQFHPVEIRNANDEADDEGIVENDDDSQNMRSIYVQGGEVSRRDRPPSGSFFAIFYERPVRHRYYQQFNRGATNLVRRLSQSRLFLNASAANRNNIRRNRQESTNSHTEQAESPQPTYDELNQDDNIETVDDIETNVSDAEHPIRTSVHSLNIRSDNENPNQTGNENRLNAIRSIASESDVFGCCTRSETPPPPYNAVANIPHK